MLPWDLCHQRNNQAYHRGVQGDGSGSEYIAVIFSRFRIPAYSGKTYPSQVSVVRVEGRPHQSRVASPHLWPLWAT